MRFEANVSALADRNPQLARDLRAIAPQKQYCILPAADRITVGVSSGSEVSPLPMILAPAAAREITAKLYPSGNCDQAVLIAGEDLGWLWNCLYQLPCNSPAAPGHRPPLFFLINDLERLWIILHMQDWQGLLADPRVRLFAGPEAFDQFRESLRENSACPWPRVSVTVDPSIWPAGMTIDALIQETAGDANQKLAKSLGELRVIAGNFTPQSIAEQYRSGRPLNVLGITSRYTTFLQYSMRDWLAAFERLGHRTQLIIEAADHELGNNLVLAQASAKFKPDLIVMIDHFRAEMGGLPQGVPMAMWVQDALPNMFCPAAGAAQGDRDYAMGFAQLKMVHEYGYPASRYMPAIVSVNEERFQPRQLSEAEISSFSCDVSFVSHASTPADVMIQGEIKRLGTPEARRLLGGIFDRIKAVYDAGDAITQPIVIRKIIEQTLIETSTSLPADQMPSLLELFTQRINNALFRHQSLQWAADLGVNLHLYGRGWENHPTLKRHARGVADNFTQLCAIYQASKINLHISPHGAGHQRVLEGLASGGFFLLRHCPGDIIEREFKQVWEWCQEEEITSDAELNKWAPPAIKARLAAIAGILRHDPFEMEYPLIEALRASAQSSYTRSAGSIFCEHYDAVCFQSASEIEQKISHFLTDENQRQRVATQMRQIVLDRFTYLSTTRRMLEFIADDQQRQALVKAAA
jgi:hypothetical protein